MSKDSDHAPKTKVKKKIYLDLSKLKAPVDMDYNITNSNRRIMVNKATRINFNDFFDIEKIILEPTRSQFNKWHQG